MLSIKPDILYAALDQTLVAVAKDDGRPSLRGVNFRVRPDAAYVESADGFRLVQIRIPLPAADAISDYTLDAAALKDTLPILKKHAKGISPTPVTLELADHMRSVAVTIGSTVVNVPVVEGSFPHVDQLIPSPKPEAAFPGNVGFNGVMVAETIGRIGKYASGRGAVRMRVQHPSEPMRFDWRGEDDAWSGTAVIMPMVLNWD